MLFVFIKERIIANIHQAPTTFKPLIYIISRTLHEHPRRQVFILSQMSTLRLKRISLHQLPATNQLPTSYQVAALRFEHRSV